MLERTRLEVVCELVGGCEVDEDMVEEERGAGKGFLDASIAILSSSQCIDDDTGIQ
jgi:hypothetical protein